MGKEFYVYIHTRNDTDLPFYVGNGAKRRAWSKHSRGRRWKFISEKHGFSVIILKDRMSERCALALEMIVIRQLRSDGYDLVNVTDGGDGVRGLMSKLRKPVCCSNGMEFESVNYAARWAGVTASKISAACRGHRKTSAGYSWWFRGSDPVEYECPKDRMMSSGRKPISCSNGMCFDSATEAARWLLSTGVSSDVSNISMCANGKINSAYGYSWWFTGNEEKEYISRYERSSISLGEPVIRSDGKIFSSAQDASRYMQKNGYPKADGWSIRQCCKGKQKTAYGYTWSLA